MRNHAAAAVGRMVTLVITVSWSTPRPVRSARAGVPPTLEVVLDDPR